MLKSVSWVIQKIYGVGFMDEEYLVAQSKKGDKNSFSALIEIYQSRLYKTACGMLGNTQDANDALQDCILKAYMSIESLKYDYYFKYWINRILINSCNDILRRRKKVIYIEDAGINEGSEDYDVTNLDIRMSLQKLDLKYRNIIALRYYQDLSYEEIAEILNCPTGTVKSRLNYALKKLRDAMNKNGLSEVGR